MNEPKTIVSHRERRANEMGQTITRRGGANDGVEFRMVEATLSDGRTEWLWKSNSHEGYFKQVFVPWDFEHDKILDF